MLKISFKETAAAVLGLWLIGTSRIYSGGFFFYPVDSSAHKLLQSYS